MKIYFMDFWIAPNWPYRKNDNDVTIYQHHIIVNLFDASVFFPCLVTGPGLGMTSYLECCAGNISTSTVTHANQEKGGLP